jgi:hypothetical protein
MSKRTILIFVIPFLLCLVGTFLLLSINQNQRKRTPTPEISGQTNFLLLHMDSLAGDPNGITSAWAVLIRTDPPASLIFKQLPTSWFSFDEEISLSLTHEGLSTSQFVRYAQDLNLDLDSYFLLDTQALTTLSSEFTDQSVTALDATFLASFCAQLEGSKARQANLNLWNNLIPAHMRTNLTFETYATIWEKLRHSASSNICKVIDLQSELSTTP